MYQFFKHKSPAGSPEPSPADTSVFSLQVYDKYCDYRVHWRRVDDSGLVSYEGDILCSAFFSDERAVFNVRSVILKVLDWARGTRLQAIRKKLQDLGSVPSVPTSPRYELEAKT